MSSPTSIVVHAVLVDDQEAGRRLAALLSGVHLSVTAISPSATVMETVEAIKSAQTVDEPSLVLLDYRLEDESDANFRGGSLAAALRDTDPDLPLVLLTTEDRLKHFVLQRPSVHSLFDFEILKEEVTSAEPEAMAARLASLADGHAAVNEALRRAESGATDVEGAIAKLLGASDRGERVLEQLHLVLATETEDVASGSPNAVARWIYQYVLKYPGLFIDGPETAAMLGVTLNSFDLLSEHLISQRYAGAFSGVKESFWFDDFVALTDRPITDRRQELASRYRLSLEAARCPWCGEEEVSRACQLCSRATDDLHSLPILTSRPAWSAPAIVCFACVAEGYAQERRLRYPGGVEDILSDLELGLIEPAEGATESQPRRER